MKTYYTKTNKGETYCCSLSIAKEMFCSDEITIDFGTNGGRIFKPYTNEKNYKYAKNNIKGTVIAELTINYPEVFSGCKSSAYLKFFILKQEDFSMQLQKEFTNNVLKKIKSFYDNEFSKNNRDAFFMVEVLNGEFIIHEKIKR